MHSYFLLIAICEYTIIVLYEVICSAKFCRHIDCWQCTILICIILSEELITQDALELTVHKLCGEQLPNYY